MNHAKQLLVSETCIFNFSRQIDKKLEEVFSKGKPHIKKAAPEAKGEQIKGEQQGEYECVIR